MSRIVHIHTTSTKCFIHICLYRFSLKYSMFWRVIAGKARVEQIKLIKAPFHLHSPVSRPVCTHGLLRQFTGTKPSLKILITPVLCLQWQVTCQKKVCCHGQVTVRLYHIYTSLAASIADRSVSSSLCISILFTTQCLDSCSYSAVI